MEFIRYETYLLQGVLNGGFLNIIPIKNLALFEALFR
jgi:hypothetical protein